MIDGYDAVFRTNAAQGSEDVRQRHACGMGARTDYHVHPDLGKVKKEAREAARRATPNARLVAKHLQEWREITRKGLPAHLATDAALRHEGHGGSGMGSGSTTLALAAALCDRVDAYGFGAYRGRGGAFAYIHFYDEEPWLGDAKGGELVFAAELRNALFDALGVFRWVWW